MTGERSPLSLKVELQSRGIRPAGGLPVRRGGAGPADGVTLFIDGLAATVPTGGLYVGASEYELGSIDGRWYVMSEGERLREVTVAGDPEFYGGVTREGTPYRSIALRHGRDAIGSTVVQGCVYGTDACAFCAIARTRESGETAARKAPGELAEVAAAARGEGFAHMVLTTGTTSLEDRGVPYLVECARAVSAACELPVHVQFEPPADLGMIAEARDCADSVAINIESFDPGVRERITPGKAATAVEAYESAWRRAVEEFGPGRVTSFLIVGLGEGPQSTVEGARRLASLGVYPYVLPVRPIRGTAIEGMSPPGSSEMMDVYERCAGVIAEAGLRAIECPSGCVRCGACSAITDFTG